MNWSAIVSRGGLYALLWWILTDGAAGSWWIGVPAVLFALVASTALLPPAHFRWHEFLRFMPLFLIRSLRGGTDVAWRAFHPRMPIAPKLIDYPLRLPPGLPRVFMANAVSLLPGTLSADLNRSVLKIHVLDGRTGFLSEIEFVEQGVARIFSMSLKVTEGDQ